MMGASQQMPQDIGQGLGALGNALMMRQQMRATQFPGAPPAPAGAAPQAFDFGNFMNKALGMNSGGGLYMMAVGDLSFAFNPQRSVKLRRRSRPSVNSRSPSWATRPMPRMTSARA
jgi:hypothetical protein